MISMRVVAVAAILLAQEASPKGIEVSDLDRTADPCGDFYAFSSGGWRAAHPIPAGAQRWGRRLAARETNRRQLTALLEDLAATADRPRGSIEQQLGDHFAACMDEAAIERAGVAPVAPLLAEIAAARDRAGVERAIRRLHEIAVPAPFVLSAASDYHDPTLMVANIAASGLGMPDRDHYLKPEPRFAEARETYRAHVTKVLTLGGMPLDQASQAAANVLALETRLAEASLPAATANDPAATAHKVPFAQLAAARFDWKTYFAEARLPLADVNVAEPEFLKRLDAELDATPVDTWKAYLAWHVLDSASPSLAKAFADESLAFQGQSLGGTAPSKTRAASCLESTETLLGEPLGRKYAERYFPPAAKARVQEMAREMLRILQDDVAGVAWMAPATRQKALAKLASYDVKIGYPDVWTDDSALAIRRDAFWADVAAARRFGVDLDRRRVGQRIARSLWQLPASSPDAYIDVQLNIMGLPAGFLQPPAFDMTASDAVNYGAIGVGMAHDFTHAIDELGADFDAAGQPGNWWTDADRQSFQEAGRCIVAQYEGYSIEPGVHLDGKRVHGEAIGDAAGVSVALRALRRSLQRHPVPTIDGFTPEQQFFIAWGQYRGGAETIEQQRQLIATDAHPVSRFRVIGPLSTTPEFRAAFACPAAEKPQPCPALW